MPKADRHRGAPVPVELLGEIAAFFHWHHSCSSVVGVKESSVETLSLDFPLGLIQGIRLAHALMETGHQVIVPPEYANIFGVLKERFGISFVVSAMRGAT